MIDELVIERIRDAMRAEVEGVAPPPELLERVLSVPPRRRLGLVRGLGLGRDLGPGRGLGLGWGRDRGLGRGLGWLAPALAVAVAAVVAIVALGSLGHRGSAPAAQPTARVPVGARGLVSELAVLRRPQTATDRLPAWAVRQVLRRAGDARLIPSLSRLVATVPQARFGLARVYLIVMTPAHAARRPRLLGSGAVGAALLNPRLGDQAATVVIVHGDLVSPASFAEPVALLHRAASEDVLRGHAQGGPGDVRGGGAVDVSIVPDGITAVRWQWSGWLPDGTQDAATTTEPAVANNVAVAPGTTTQGVLAGATWYDRAGHAVASFSDATEIAQQQRSQRRAIQRTARNVIAPSLTALFSVLRDPPPAPAQITSIPTGGGSNGMGLNYAQARFVPYPGAPTQPGEPHGLWVVGGSHGVSLVSDGLNVAGSCRLSWPSCTPSENPGKGVFLLGSTGYRSGSRTIQGLVPDGNATVTVVMADGADRSARVIDNVFSITVPKGAVALVDKNAAGLIVRTSLG